MKISLSVLSVDYKNFKDSVSGVFENSDYIHLDIMDGEFVPNISFGPDVALSISEMKKDNVPFDTHLMLMHPQKYIEAFVNAKSDYITFHVEADCKPLDVINQIKSYGVKAGIAVNPETPIERVFEYLPYVDMVLVMSVHPGRGGQKFMDVAIDKVKKLKELKDKNNYNYLINIDGGINNETLPLVKDYLDLAVSGSYLTKPNYEERMRRLKLLQDI